MTIEGVRDFDMLRDYLYSKMRGTKSPDAKSLGEASHATGTDAELAEVLREVASEVRALRVELDKRREGVPNG